MSWTRQPFDLEDHGGAERASRALDTALTALGEGVRVALASGAVLLSDESGTAAAEARNRTASALLATLSRELGCEMARSLAIARAASAARAARGRRAGGGGGGGGGGAGGAGSGGGVDMLGGGSVAVLATLNAKAITERAEAADAIMSQLAETRLISGAAYAAYLAGSIVEASGGAGGGGGGAGAAGAAAATH